MKKNATATGSAGFQPAEWRELPAPKSEASRAPCLASFQPADGAKRRPLTSRPNLPAGSRRSQSLSRHPPPPSLLSSDAKLNSDNPTLILGVGNLLLCDEGVGIHVIHALDALATAATDAANAAGTTNAASSAGAACTTSATAATAAASALAPLPPHVRTLDGGTGGFHLIGTMQEHARVIIIDATLDDKPPGTVTLLEPRHAADFPPLLSAHEIGLRDMIEAMMLTGRVPRMNLITISAANINEVGMDLTPAVKAAIPKVIATIKTLLNAR